MKKRLVAKIFEGISPSLLELNTETFFRENPDIEVVSVGYSGQKVSEGSVKGYYSCILVYRK